jgi:hypothetical protein
MRGGQEEDIKMNGTKTDYKDRMCIKLKALASAIFNTGSFTRDLIVGNLCLL